jgi:CRAL/TRIO domain
MIRYLYSVQVVKYFLDPKTYHKVNFVYSKNEDSIKVLHEYFDPELLPLEFGGMNKTEYDHEEFSKMMEKDDIKTVAFWGLENKVGPQTEQPSNRDVALCTKAEETPCVVAQAS